MPTLIRIAIAATKIEEMRRFYNLVFEANFEVQATEMGNFYQGQLAGLALTLVPNTVAKVVAEQNRQQLSLLVDNVEAVLAKAEQSGGKRLGDVLSGPAGYQAAIIDPDGNTIELLQQN